MLKKRQNEVKRNIFLYDKVKKNIAGEVLKYNSKNFHWLNKKLDLELTMKEMGKLFLKKNLIKKILKKTEKQYQNAACGQKTISKEWKFGWNKKLGPERTKNEMGKPIRKNRIDKIEKTFKIKVKLPHVKRTTIEKPNFCSNTVFSLYFGIRAKKKFTPQYDSLFRSTSYFSVTKITTPIWLQKSWKCVNRS